MALPEFFSLRKNVYDSATKVEEILSSARLEEQESTVADLEHQAAQSDLWEDPAKAQITLSHLTDLKGDLTMLKSFRSKVSVQSPLDNFRFSDTSRVLGIRHELNGNECEYQNDRSMGKMWN